MEFDFTFMFVTYFTTQKMVTGPRDQTRDKTKSRPVRSPSAIRHPWGPLSPCDHFTRSGHYAHPSPTYIYKYGSSKEQSHWFLFNCSATLSKSKSFQLRELSTFISCSLQKKYHCREIKVGMCDLAHPV